VKSAIHAYSVIYNNVFIFAPLLPIFFSSMPTKQNSVLLSYLLLPIVLHPPSQTFLVNANKRSAMRTLVSERERIYGIEKRLNERRAMTNLCIQYGIDVTALLLHGDGSVSARADALPIKNCPENVVAATRRLGQLFTPFDVPTVFRMLGIKRL
jgi:hypothetical protein